MVHFNQHCQSQTKKKTLYFSKENIQLVVVATSVKIMQCWGFSGNPISYIDKKNIKKIEFSHTLKIKNTWI